MKRNTIVTLAVVGTVAAVAFIGMSSNNNTANTQSTFLAADEQDTEVQQLF